MNKPSPVRSSLNNAPVVAPETAPAPAGPDLLLMEGSIFWDKYKLPIVAAILLLVVALVASEFYAMARDKRIQTASAELDAAKTPAAYQHVIETYPGTVAAANAALLLGREQFEAKDYAGAAATWQTFATKNPQHSLAPVALIGAGTALEAVGKKSDARGLYQRVSTSYQSSFAAPLARLEEASLLTGEQKPEEARRVYENIMASDANSDAGRDASAELQYLRVTPGKPGSTLLPGASVPRPAAPVASAIPAATAAPTTAKTPTEVAAPSIVPVALPPKPAATPSAPLPH